MYKISVVDDEKSACEEIGKLLSDYGTKHGICFDVNHYIGPDEYAAAHDEESDIIFLDIDMPETNGIELAKKIRKARPNVVLIFCTNLEQFAVNGYEVDACGYIVKPIRKCLFYFYLEKAFRLLERNKKWDETKIYIKTNEGRRSVCVRNIGYVEVAGHKLYYHIYKGGLPDGIIQSRGSMQEIEALLAPLRFVRSSISYLINLSYVMGIRGYEVYLPDIVLFMSRNYKKSFVEAFMQSIAEDGISVK